jgi:hypothetical protein
MTYFIVSLIVKNLNVKVIDTVQLHDKFAMLSVIKKCALPNSFSLEFISQPVELIKCHNSFYSALNLQCRYQKTSGAD